MCNDYRLIIYTNGLPTAYVSAVNKTMRSTFAELRFVCIHPHTCTSDDNWGSLLSFNKNAFWAWNDSVEYHESEKSDVKSHETTEIFVYCSQLDEAY